MLVIWDDGIRFPDWIVDHSCWVCNESSWCNWCNWVDANCRTRCWLWSFTGSNNGVGKIISQWDVKSFWLSITCWLESLKGNRIDEIAPFSAIREFNPLSSNSRLN